MVKYSCNKGKRPSARLQLTLLVICGISLVVAVSVLCWSVQSDAWAGESVAFCVLTAPHGLEDCRH